MKKKTGFLLSHVLCVSAFVFLTACATTVRVQTERPPAMDTAGINRIAVMPFETGVFAGQLHREMAHYITNAAARGIQRTGHFTLVSPAEIERLRRFNQSIEGYADALFSGRITHISVNDSSSQRQRRGRDGQTITYTVFTREASMNFNYFFSLARDGRLIGPVHRGNSIIRSSENRSELPTASQMLREIADSELRFLYRDVAPHIVNETRRIANEPSRDRSLRAQMDDARTLVRVGNYRAALNSYLEIYAQHGNVTAALNAAVLHEALGNADAAANFLQVVYVETRNPSVRSEINRLNRVLRDQALVAGMFAGQQTAAERAAAHASNEVKRVLPAGASLFIANNTAAWHNIADDVVDSMTSIFIRSGVNIVERTGISLIMAEQDLHLSGLVSDNDFMSIGNMAGANTAVIVSITGAAAARRLQVRVLDLERGVPIMQSDTSEAWML